MVSQPSKPRALIYSQRNIFGNALFRCPHFEFEDIICEIDSAELLAPELDPHSARSQLAMRLAYHAPIRLNPGIRAKPAGAQYDLFFTVCGGLAFPIDFLLLDAVSEARDLCRASVCLVDELWVKQMYRHRHFLRALEKFDVVMLYYSQTVKPLSEHLGKKCVFLPPGIDAISFCPYPSPPQRVVDVYSIGRRSEITHQRLMRLAQEKGLFYLYDSIGGHEAINSKQHRTLFANVAKRSRYFIVNPGLIDRPEKRGNQFETSNRYFEGAASGAIMIGERPANEEFEKLFPWPDAVTQMPYDSDDVDMLIKRLDGDRERQDALRRTGVVQSLMRHDWAYRWEAILKAAGLEPMQGLSDRKQRLKKLAEVTSQSDRFTTETLA
jgi:glycosyltransferase involved in cell wall biosynthesis